MRGLAKKVPSMNTDLDWTNAGNHFPSQLFPCLQSSCPAVSCAGELCPPARALIDSEGYVGPCVWLLIPSAWQWVSQKAHLLFAKCLLLALLTRGALSSVGLALGTPPVMPSPRLFLTCVFFVSCISVSCYQQPLLWQSYNNGKGYIFIPLVAWVPPWLGLRFRQWNSTYCKAINRVCNLRPARLLISFLRTTLQPSGWDPLAKSKIAPPTFQWELIII